MFDPRNKTSKVSGLLAITKHCQLVKIGRNKGKHSRKHDRISYFHAFIPVFDPPASHSGLSSTCQHGRSEAPFLLGLLSLPTGAQGQDKHRLKFCAWTLSACWQRSRRYWKDRLCDKYAYPIARNSPGFWWFDFHLECRLGWGIWGTPKFFLVAGYVYQ